MYEDVDERKKRRRNAAGGGGGGCTSTGIALTAFSILALLAGLIATTATFAINLQSLQTQINNMNALAPNMTQYALPCYGPGNQPTVPAQMQCIGDGVTIPAQNCDLAYYAIPGGDLNGPGLCGAAFVTRMGPNTTVTIGVAASIYYANNTSNANTPYNPGNPFTYVSTMIRWNDMIPIGLRPATQKQTIAIAEFGLPETMIATMSQLFFNTDGSIAILINYGDTVPGPELHIGFNVAVTYITYTV